MCEWVGVSESAQEWVQVCVSVRVQVCMCPCVSVHKSGLNGCKSVCTQMCEFATVQVWVHVFVGKWVQVCVQMSMCLCGQVYVHASSHLNGCVVGVVTSLEVGILANPAGGRAVGKGDSTVNLK